MDRPGRLSGQPEPEQRIANRAEARPPLSPILRHQRPRAAGRDAQGRDLPLERVFQGYCRDWRTDQPRVGRARYHARRHLFGVAGHADHLRAWPERPVYWQAGRPVRAAGERDHPQNPEGRRQGNAGLHGGLAVRSHSAARGPDQWLQHYRCHPDHQRRNRDHQRCGHGHGPR